MSNKFYEYPPTHQKRENDVLSGSMNMDASSYSVILSWMFSIAVTSKVDIFGERQKKKLMTRFLNSIKHQGEAFCEYS